MVDMSKETYERNGVVDSDGKLWLNVKTYRRRFRT